MAAAGKLGVAEMAGEVKALTQAVSQAVIPTVRRRLWGSGGACCRTAPDSTPQPKRLFTHPTPAPSPLPEQVRKAALQEQLTALTKRVLEEQKKAAAANKEKAVAAAVEASDAGARCRRRRGGWTPRMGSPRRGGGHRGSTAETSCPCGGQPTPL